MCELVVWKIDTHAADPYIDAQAWKKGDVICVMEDGHEFTKAERSNPDWLILSLPGVPASAAASFEAQEPETDPSRPNRMRQKRMHRLDLTKKVKTLEQLMAARVKKPRLQDPNVL